MPERDGRGWLTIRERSNACERDAAITNDEGCTGATRTGHEWLERDGGCLHCAGEVLALILDEFHNFRLVFGLGTHAGVSGLQPCSINTFFFPPVT